MIFNKSRLFISAILGSLCAVNAVRDDVVVLMYETDASLHHGPETPLSFFLERAKIAKLETTVFGGNKEYHGFGDKYPPLKPLLETMKKDKLVILADARDVVLNVPANEAVATLAIDNFVATYQKLTADSPNAVVVSAEAQCCVAAMAHNAPYDYFDQNTKERTMRACPSGADNCPWFPSEHLDEWKNWMKELAFKTTGEKVSDVYLNAGLMVGYPGDLLNLINVANMDPSEDDQAVLSGMMYQFPDMIVLDYEGSLFGNNEDGCVFESQGENFSLFHTETENEPLILHTSGKFNDCLDVLIEDLSGVSEERYLEAQDEKEIIRTIRTEIGEITKLLGELEYGKKAKAKKKTVKNINTGATEILKLLKKFEKGKKKNKKKKILKKITAEIVDCQKLLDTL